MEPQSKVNVLLLDDSLFQLAATEKIMQEMPDLRVFKARTTQEAWDLLKEHEFGVIISDINMPTSGFEFFAEMQKDPQTRFIPVIFVTGTHRDNEAVRQKAMALGAAAVLNKPLEPSVLWSKVKVFADLFRAKQKVRADFNRGKMD